LHGWRHGGPGVLRVLRRRSARRAAARSRRRPGGCDRRGYCDRCGRVPAWSAARRRRVARAEGGPVTTGEDRATHGPVSALQVYREDIDGRMVLTLTGELDITTLPLARTELADAELTEPTVLIVDLSRLRFMDSSGVGLVLQADSRARAAHRRLVIV